jgi:hypothetical protein
MNEEAKGPHSSERRIAFWLPIFLGLGEAVSVLFIFGHNPLKLWAAERGEILIISGCLLATTLPYLLLALAAHSLSRLLFMGSLILTILVALADLLILAKNDTCKEILVLLFVKANEISVVVTLLAVLWVTAWFQKRAK